MEVLLNDSSVLLNLLAADCLASIAADTGWQFAICPAVRDEVKRLRDAQTGEMHRSGRLPAPPHIVSGLLQILELSGEEEELLDVEQSHRGAHDGEAMSIAIAVHRQLALAILMISRPPITHTGSSPKSVCGALPAHSQRLRQKLVVWMPKDFARPSDLLKPAHVTFPHSPTHSLIGGVSRKTEPRRDSKQHRGIQHERQKTHVKVSVFSFGLSHCGCFV